MAFRRSGVRLPSGPPDSRFLSPYLTESNASKTVGTPWARRGSAVGTWAELPELVGQPAGLPDLSFSESEADHEGEGSPGHGSGAATDRARGRLGPVPAGAAGQPPVH